MVGLFNVFIPTNWQQCIQPYVLASYTSDSAVSTLGWRWLHVYAVIKTKGAIIKRRRHVTLSIALYALRYGSAGGETKEGRSKANQQKMVSLL